MASMLYACNPSNKGRFTDSHEQHDHEHEHPTLSYTLFQDNYELFVEFPALVVGHKSLFAAHFTKLSTYKPALECKLELSLFNGHSNITQKCEGSVSPGIYRPSIIPKEEGSYKILFLLETKEGNVQFEIPNITVYASVDEAAHAISNKDEGDVITYLKEQAWKTEFGTEEIRAQEYYSVIHTSARVKPHPTSEAQVHANASGALMLFNTLGERLKKGQLIALVKGAGIDNNTTLQLNEAKISFQKSKADYIRSEPLSKSKLISQKAFLDIKSRYQHDSLMYHQLAKQITEDGLRIEAPIDGFISNIMVANGAIVKSGDQLLTITNNNSLIIESYVNQSDYQKVEGIFDANFSVLEGKGMINLSDIAGELVANTAFVNEGNLRIPVGFSVSKNDLLMPGMYLEAYLKTGKLEDALLVPLSSIIEEQGQYYVFVQIGGESFVKRQVEITNSDGLNAQVVRGLIVGDRIVIQGAYQIKLAALSSDLPTHGHAH